MYSYLKYSLVKRYYIPKLTKCRIIIFHMVILKVLCKKVFYFCFCHKREEEHNQIEHEVNREAIKKNSQLYHHTELLEEQKNKAKSKTMVDGLNPVQPLKSNQNYNPNSSKNPTKKKNQLNQNSNQIERNENIELKRHSENSENFKEFKQNENINRIERSQSNLNVTDQQDIVINFSDDECERKNDIDSKKLRNEKQIFHDKSNKSSNKNKAFQNFSKYSNDDDYSELEDEIIYLKPLSAEKDNNRYLSCLKSNESIQMVLEKKKNDKILKEKEISEKKKMYTAELDKLLKTSAIYKENYEKTKVKDSIEAIHKLDEELKLTEEMFIEKVFENEDQIEEQLIHIFSTYSKKMINDNRYLSQKLVQLHFL